MSRDEIEFTHKYRPKAWEEFFGNASAIKSIQSNIDNTHTYLFYGQRGCGKTTAARLIGVELGIDNPLDIVEINGAQHTGVKEARELESRARLQPKGDSNKKLIIIDEVHRCSKNAQDQLLKILEEPPSYLYIVLCTTEFDKVLVPVRSRGTKGKYHFTRLPRRNIADLVDHIKVCEEIELTPRVERLLIDSCDGIPREVVANLDRIKNMDEDEALDVLGSVAVAESEDFKNLLKLLGDTRGTWEKAATLIKKLDIKDDNVEKLRVAVMRWFEKVLLSTGSAQAKLVMTEFEERDLFFANGRSQFILAISRVLD